MKISAIRSDKVYSKIMNAPLDKKNDIYRYELMKPFEKKWACYSVPMKALTPNGYHLIKHYLQKTGKNIVEATLLPAKEILNATEDFWNE